jgi:hypothetical protein
VQWGFGRLPCRWKQAPPKASQFTSLETVWGAETSRKNLRRKAAEEKVGIGGPQKKK